MWIDVTYPVNDELLIYPGDPPYKRTVCSSMEKGDYCNVSQISLGCHTGTHVDAPLHFVPGGASVDVIDLDRINGPVRVIGYDILGDSPQDIGLEFLKSCHIQPGERLLFKTSNGRRFKGKTLLKDYAAIDLAAAQYLVRMEVKCIGIDYLTIEPAGSGDGAVHKTILGAGIPVIETLNLESVTPGRYEMMCLPLRLSGAEASPVRALLKSTGAAKG